MPTIHPKSAERLHYMADKKDGEKVVAAAKFDAQYVDRDGREYAAHIQHAPPNEAARESESLFRVWVDAHDKEVLFKAGVNDGGRERDEFYKLWYDPDGAQRQARVGADEARELAAGCAEYRCLLFTPRSTPHSLSPGETSEPYAHAIKIPVVDLLVDFGDARGPRINHVGNVRHQRHAGARPGEMRMPYYVECKCDVIGTDGAADEVKDA